MLSRGLDIGLLAILADYPRPLVSEALLANDLIDEALSGKKFVDPRRWCAREQGMFLDSCLEDAVV